ncbi:MAG: AAA family ATPase [Thermoleophilaceae bacterium]|nr:AAA family ATPase [Thermoleophilaceae bacterium]
MRVVGETPLLEREAELAVAERALDAARSGEGSILLVEGPPGVGKTSVLAAVRELAGGFRVLRARGSELEREFLFGVVRQLFEPVLAGSSDAERDQLLVGAAALAESVLGSPGTRNGAGGDMFAALHGLYWFAVNLSEARPLLLLVDDAHWADPPSLRWLAYLGQRLEGLPVALAVAARPGEPGAEQASALEAVSGPLVEAVRLAPLTPEATAHLVEQTLEEVPEEPFVAACQRVSGGNPFLLGELLDELSREGVAPSAASGEIIERLTPARVSRVAVQRLRRLPPRCTALARAVAILGDGVELRTAAELTGLGGEDAAAAADELAAASLFEGSRPLRYLHPLLRAGVLDELAAGERAALHACAAQCSAPRAPHRSGSRCICCTSSRATSRTPREHCVRLPAPRLRAAPPSWRPPTCAGHCARARLRSSRRRCAWNSAWRSSTAARWSPRSTS